MWTEVFLLLFFCFSLNETAVECKMKRSALGKEAPTCECQALSAILISYKMKGGKRKANIKDVFVGCLFSSST